MKSIEQLSIFLENRTGRLSEITHLLAQEKVSIRTLELVEAGDFGILRLIVPDVQTVKTRLNAQGISAKITQVVAVEVEDEVGCFHHVVSTLADEGIDIAYTYTVSHAQAAALVIKISHADMARAISRLEANGMKVLDAI